MVQQVQLDQPDQLVLLGRQVLSQVLLGTPGQRGQKEMMVIKDQLDLQEKTEVQGQQAPQAQSPDQRDRLGAVVELVPLGRRVALDLPDLREVVVLQGTKALRVIPGRRVRQELRAQREVLAQLEQEGVQVRRVPQGLQALLEQGALRVLPDRQVRAVPDQPAPPDLQERTVQLLGPQVPQEQQVPQAQVLPATQVLPEPQALPEPQVLPVPQALPEPRVL